RRTRTRAASALAHRRPGCPCPCAWSCGRRYRFGGVVRLCGFRCRVGGGVYREGLRSMPRIIDDSMVETVPRVLLGVIDGDDGGTDEERAVLRALVEGYYERPDLDIDAMSALGPDEAADAVTDPAHRRRVHELMALLESCRHPLTEAQVDRVEAYAKALH